MILKHILLTKRDRSQNQGIHFLDVFFLTASRTTASDKTGTLQCAPAAPLRKFSQKKKKKAFAPFSKGAKKQT